MISFPNAKINLGLNVVSKRPDGYHNIETIFYPIPVKDALEIVRADTFSFTQTGLPVDAPIEKNLVVKALNLLKSRYEIPELEVHLLKAIPFGAGLGGGSADAAFMLKLLNDYCGLHIPDDDLEELASSIGADCPFFIRNRPVFASGTGNIFEPVELSLAGYHLCLVSRSLFDGDTRSAGNLFKRNYRQTGRRMEATDGKRFREKRLPEASGHCRDKKHTV